MPAAGPTSALESSAAYAEKHKVFQLFEGLLQDLLIQKPQDPISHLIKSLKVPSVPRVIVAGPPGVDALAQCQLLAMRLSLEVVNEPDLWRDAAKAGTPSGLAAKALVDEGKLITPELRTALLSEKLKSPDCVSKGWILAGFPTNASLAHAFVSAGLLPTAFIFLSVDDEELTRRLVGKRVDPVDQAVYHIEDSPPSDPKVAARLIVRPEDEPESVEERLNDFAQEMNGVLQVFSSVLKRVDASSDTGEALCEHILPFVTPDMPTRAPRGAPRVLLLGPPGAAVDPVARACSERYGVVCVSAVELLQVATLKGGATAKKIKPYLDKGDAEKVPDEVVAPLVMSRLAQEDVRKRGFVLVGFPASTSQLAMLNKAMPDPIRHAVLLDMSPEAATRALVEKRYDPLDGSIYHPDGDWPVDPNVLERLVPHHHHTKKQVAAKMKAWNAGKAALCAALPQLVTEDGTRDPLAIEERLAPYF